MVNIHGFDNDKNTAPVISQADYQALQEQFAEMQNTINDYWKKLYPVGAIYISTTQTNPANFLGGSWVAWGSGRVPVGVNTSDSAFNAPEKTGGEKSHTLTMAEMPNHDGHVLYNGNWTILSQYGTQYSSRPYRKEASNEIVPNGQKLGGGAAHNNLQPYITCFMWKRIQ